jgi:hypothetical protein
VARTRMRKSRTALTLATAIIVSSVGIVTMNSIPASAATCSGYGCDGLDPNAAGCSDGANDTASTYLYSANGSVVGLLELRYSPSCGTNWSRVTSYIGVHNLYARVTRESDGGGYADVGNYQVIWSNMVYAYNITACATGAVLQISNTPQVCG